MKILIAGLGLIGGSFALALRDRGIADEILGVEKSDENAAEALRLGLADRIVTLEEGVPQADLVVLATPVDTIPLMAVKALNHVTDRQVVMDMGSIKAELCEVISMHARRGRFVAAHPMGHRVQRAAGRAARSLHGPQRRRVRGGAQRRRRTGGRRAHLPRAGRPRSLHGSREHDLHAAYVSHISHVTSFALALTVLEKSARSGTSSTLRAAVSRAPCGLAKSAAATWVPILLRNKYNVLDVLREHIHQLQIMRRMIERDDAEGLTSAFEQGQFDPAHHPLTAMGTTAETGRMGERAAAEFLRHAGYEICALNWRSGRYELDIVARKGISCTSWRSRPDVRTDSRRPKRP